MVTFWSCWAAGHVASTLITAAATRKKRFAIFIDAPVGGSAARNPPYAQSCRPGSAKAARRTLHCRWLRHLQVEHLLRVVLEDHLLVGIAEPLDRFDGEARLVEPAAGARVLHGADAGPLGAEQAAIDADGLEQQLERVLRVEHRAVIEV